MRRPVHTAVTRREEARISARKVASAIERLPPTEDPQVVALRQAALQLSAAVIALADDADDMERRSEDQSGS